MADYSLTSLCKICNNEPSKYTCPRCSSRTCSLVCYKKHQSRSQCSGKRDPAVYKKRSELATSSNIDHDYNFLTSIERAIETASKASQPPVDNRNAKIGGRILQLDRILTQQGVSVRRAPDGLSRQRQNRTRWVPQDQCIIWTIEWCLPDGIKCLQSGRDSLSVKDLYNQLSFNSLKSTRKRKRNKLLDDHGLEVGRDLSDGQDRNLERSLFTDGAGGTDLVRGFEGQETSDDQRPSDDPHQRTGATELEATTEPQGSTDHPSDPSLLPGFFLVKPFSRGGLQILQGLEPERSLRDNLRGTTVVEFPTIHIFHNKKVPPGYSIEARSIETTADHRPLAAVGEEVSDQERASEGSCKKEPV